MQSSSYISDSDILSWTQKMNGWWWYKPDHFVTMIRSVTGDTRDSELIREEWAGKRKELASFIRTNKDKFFKKAELSRKVVEPDPTVTKFIELVSSYNTHLVGDENLADTQQYLLEATLEYADNRSLRNLVFAVLRSLLDILLSHKVVSDDVKFKGDLMLKDHNLITNVLEALEKSLNELKTLIPASKSVIDTHFPGYAKPVEKKTPLEKHPSSIAPGTLDTKEKLINLLIINKNINLEINGKSQNTEESSKSHSQDTLTQSSKEKKELVNVDTYSQPLMILDELIVEPSTEEELILPGGARYKYAPTKDMTNQSLKEWVNNPLALYTLVSKENWYSGLSQKEIDSLLPKILFSYLNRVIPKQYHLLSPKCKRCWRDHAEPPGKCPNPVFCASCEQTGHHYTACPSSICSNCESTGHHPKACKAPCKTCKKIHAFHLPCGTKEGKKKQPPIQQQKQTRSKSKQKLQDKKKKPQNKQNKTQSKK
jgi:hypothetical protein